MLADIALEASALPSKPESDASRSRRRLLLISPHFPPDTSAGTHRVRLLARHLPACGWDPTVLTVDPEGYETRLDQGLLGLVSDDLRVVRSRPFSSARTRRFGVGDLGLRSLAALGRDASRLLSSTPFDAMYITTYPVYPALLGPRLKRRFRVPFVLDFQDPWVGSWGKTVGPGEGSRPDLKSRCSRATALMLEAWIAPQADAITAVSRGTFDELAARHPRIAHTPFLELPIGADAGDLAASVMSGVNRCFGHGDGFVHVCSVGTILPRGWGVLEGVLRAVARLRDENPAAFARLRLHFVGTSNQTSPDAPARVLPLAERCGVSEAVAEMPARVDYLDALAIQREADALLLVGSDEPHYTASKLYPALMVARPLVAVYHHASTVVEALERAGSVPPVWIVRIDEDGVTEIHVSQIAEAIAAIVNNPSVRSEPVAAGSADRLGPAAAPRLTARFAAFLDSLPSAGSR